MPESSLIVRVPEAEAHVGRYRDQFDPSARLGVPAHVTVLYPFMPPELITPPVLARVRACISAASGFTFRLEEVGRFPGVVYLAPEPSEPFASLTRAIVRAFPDYPSYRGEHAGIVPHLTFAQTDEPQHGAVAAELRAALARCDGIVCTCAELALIENSTGRWEPMHVFRLGAAASREQRRC